MTAPTLPEPAAWVYEVAEERELLLDQPKDLDGKPTGIALYTADQLTAAVMAERERCAKLCDEIGNHSRHADPGCSDADECAAAIRAKG